MNAKSFVSSASFSQLMTSIIDLENSNLPIDYFTSVLPRAQYGDESAVSVGSDKSAATFIVKDSADPSKGVLFGLQSHTPDDTLTKADEAPVPVDGRYATVEEERTQVAYPPSTRVVGASSFTKVSLGE